MLSIKCYFFKLHFNREAGFVPEVEAMQSSDERNSEQARNNMNRRSRKVTSRKRLIRRLVCFCVRAVNDLRHAGLNVTWEKLVNFQNKSNLVFFF